MDNFESLKEIWLSEKAEILPNSDEIKSMVKKYHSSKKRNIYLLILGVILCFFTMVFVAIFTEVKHWTRFLGEAFMFLGVLMTLILKLKTLIKANNNELITNQEFLDELIIKTEKKSQYNIYQIITIIIIGLGYGLFIYKDVYQDKNIMFLAYFGILVFLIFMYFVFKPFAEGVSRKKSEKLLKNINQIQNQI